MSTSEILDLQLIFHFAFCILQNLPVAKTDFSRRIRKVDMQLCYVGLHIEFRVHLSTEYHMQPEMTKAKAIAFGGSTEFHIGHPS